METIGDDLWNFRFADVNSEASVIIEYIPEGFDLSPGSVKGGGVYHVSERKIVWTLDESTIPESLSYQISALSPGAIPRSVGALELSGQSRLAIDDARYGSVERAESALEKFELSKRPTLDQVRDLRTGSALLNVSEGSASLKVKVQQSDNLSDWEDVSETTLDVAADVPVRFYRYVPLLTE